MPALGYIETNNCRCCCRRCRCCCVQSLNYAPVAVGLVLCVSLGWWFADARKWFTGPRKTVEEEEDGQECKDLMTPPRVQQHVETRMYSGS